VLLARGAKRVYAVDVGRDQLHASLRGHPNVVSREQQDIRTLKLDEPAAFLTIDVSFISLKLVLPAATALMQPTARLVTLIKPQFEAGSEHNKKGIVRDSAVHVLVCDEIRDHAISLGWRVLDVISSPIEGGDGNREFLLGAVRD
jgi:23S rRNA (cytidine1920-2'-O)/16S rRNA (cytidine1409-2'-O)-methyltransferase